MKFSAWAMFVPLWLLLVLVPGLQVGLRRLALASAARSTSPAAPRSTSTPASPPWPRSLVLGQAQGLAARRAHPPHSMPLVMLGTGILWFGWFGFNAGSALGANGQAAQAFMNTFLAAAAGRARLGARRALP